MLNLSRLQTRFDRQYDCAQKSLSQERSDKQVKKLCFAQTNPRKSMFSHFRSGSEAQIGTILHGDKMIKNDTIATRIWNSYFEIGKTLIKLEKEMGQKRGDSKHPILLSVRSGGHS